MPGRPRRSDTSRPSRGAADSTRSIREGRVITSFFIAAQVIAGLSFAVSWLRGGHVERFGAAVLFCDYALTFLASDFPGGHAISAASAFIVTVIFIGLSFRSGRWWPLVATPALILCVMVFVLEWLNPDLSRYAAGSARIGLWGIVYLALLAGTAERWLAGEPASRGRAASRRREVS